ncbi:hypothetical protein [Microbacterium sp. SORGH_AS_0888]|uniref:hypothetical protein n=1 Tax=Microbacterium sp. SORGH_AS_0888 TaxID=3041791 RepID=UPI0027872567|nr:hypothetical protein [Microbacterium sp. SORGH_AS_0888]MDQ1130670.1 hypothetical protein [Microbacterium sp. SORGH_AS_0888]
MSIYNPETLNHLNARDLIDRAYQAAGLTAPNRVSAFSALLREEPTAHDVAVKYATLAVDGERDAKKLLEDAIRDTARATAADSLRDIVNRTIDAIALERIDTLREKATKDLTRPFNTVTKRLTDAAKKLDHKDPLNREIAFDQDTTEAFKEAQAALAALAAFTFAAPNHIDYVNARASRILAIVDVPVVDTPASAVRGALNGPRPVKDADTGRRNTIKWLLVDADRDIDRTLIRIARGEYQGVTFSLATPEALERRTRSAQMANRVTILAEEQAVIL